MKYKVGDKVKIKEDFSYSKIYKIGTSKRMEKYAGKIMTIRKEYEGSTYKMQEDINDCDWQDGWTWSEDMFEKVGFTKSDLKDGDIVTYRNGEKRIKIDNKIFDKSGTLTNWLHNYTEDLRREYKQSKHTDIVKVERPIGYGTIFERKEEILDETEKRYLSSVIRPFKRDEIRHMKIETSSGGEFLKIRFRDNDCMSFKNFKKDTMYKGMKREREYTLEELGL